MPLRFTTHSTRREGLRSSSITADESLPPGAESSSERSATTISGQPAISRSRDGASIARSCSASGVGVADTKIKGMSLRRARSAATSRACHVGEASDWRRSSCSSITMIEPNLGSLAKTAVRVPMTTSTPAAARAHSCGSNAVVTPALATRDFKMVASSTPGTTTSTGPRSTQLQSDGSTSEVGGRRNTPPLCASNRVVAGDRGSGANVEYVAVPMDRTTRGGEAARKNCDRLPAHR